MDCSYGCASRSSGVSLADSSPAQLDAGNSLTLQGQSAASLTGYIGGFYGAQLNATITRFLWGGLLYSVEGKGGAKVGAFSVTNTASVPSVQFTGMRISQDMPRSADLTVQWTDADPKMQDGQVTIGGYSGNDDFSQFVMMQCTAPAAAQKFTIPGWVLSTLPPSGSGQSGTVTFPQGWIWIGQYNKPARFDSSGLDRGIFTDVFYQGYGVYYR